MALLRIRKTNWSYLDWTVNMIVEQVPLSRNQHTPTSAHHHNHIQMTNRTKWPKGYPSLEPVSLANAHPSTSPFLTAYFLSAEHVIRFKVQQTWTRMRCYWTYRHTTEDSQQSISTSADAYVTSLFDVPPTANAVVSRLISGAEGFILGSTTTTKVIMWHYRHVCWAKQT